jgi:AraC-like DNA-binding protein
MMPDSFTTRPLRTRDQFEAWRAWYQPVFDLTPKHPAAGGFSAEINLWTLGGMAITRTIAPPADIMRTRGHLRYEPVDHWIISYCARGAHSAITAGVRLEVPARVPFLWSLGQEFLHERTHVDRFQIIMARDAYREMAPVLDAALGSTLDTPLGHVLGDYMIALERQLPNLAEADLLRIGAATAAIVGAAVAPTAERIAVARRQIDLGRMERVRQIVHRHLHTPTLRPNTLWRLVGMSRSNLYRLLQESGGVAHYIQRQRLLEAHRKLADPANAQTISALAEDLCFADGSSFSRAFKHEFGCNPSEVRSAAVAGLRLVTLPQRRASSEKADFGALLHRF